MLSYLETEIVDFIVYGIQLAAILDFSRHFNIFTCCLELHTFIEIYTLLLITMNPLFIALLFIGMLCV